MPPPLMDSLEAGQQANSHFRAASLLQQSRFVVPKLLGFVLEGDRSVTIRRPPKKKNSGDSEGSFRFVVVDHPEKLKDKSQMRKNRQHVMYDFLDKERSKPEPKDRRVTGKRKRESVAHPRSSPNPLAPKHIFSTALAVSTPSSGSNASPPTYSDPETDMTRSCRYLSSEGEEPSAGSTNIARTTVRNSETPSRPLITGQGASVIPRHFFDTDAGSISFPLVRFDGKLNPFETWPVNRHPSLNLVQLKWNCSRRFGSRSLTVNWVPSLLSARHAFVSTIAISAAHDDVMARATLPEHMRTSRESLERTQVRSEATQLINESLSDPKLRLADATIVAVLHMLNAEIMGCDDNFMRTHQRGLYVMVQQRGGLDALGIHGELASMLTITMYIIGALREMRPHPEFLDYARRKRTTPLADPKSMVPESPMYCRLSGFATISNALPLRSPTYELLDDVRRFTKAFYVRRMRKPSVSTVGIPTCPSLTTPPSGHEATTAFWTLRDRIFARPHAENSPLACASTGDKYIYESIRLTSRVYTEALANEIPFSQAARRLKQQATKRPSSIPQDPFHHQSLPIQIRDALIRTDLSSCWSHLAGVLFWITLVAGAAANPEAVASAYVARRENGEDEEARKCLAAITVRASISLSFEFPAAMLGTLKAVAEMQETLGTDREVEGEEEVVSAVGEETVEKVAWRPREDIGVHV